MRSSTRESKDGWIYGTTHGTGELFRYRPADDKLELLGPAWLAGDYVTVVGAVARRALPLLPARRARPGVPRAARR